MVYPELKYSSYVYYNMYFHFSIKVSSYLKKEREREEAWKLKVLV